MKITKLKIFQVFTKAYKEETQYINLMRNNTDLFKFKSDNYNVEEKIKVLKDRGK